MGGGFSSRNIGICEFDEVVLCYFGLYGVRLSQPGTIIDVSIYLAHKREAIYPKPEKFQPERFLEKQFSHYEFLPFGGGQCRCLGASLALYEMKLVLATIVSNFNLELIDPKPLKPKRHGIVMIPPNLKIKIV